MSRRLSLFAASAILVLSGCSSSSPPKEPEKSAEPPKPAVTDKAPEGKVYKVRLDTSKGPVVIEVHEDWAPIGAQRFRELLDAHYFDGARFFRIVPNFVVQFGLAANPAVTKKWDKPIKDDPVAKTNRTGSLSFATAGPNTRTTQIFINLRGNQMLDSQGFAPFAQVVEGMDVVEKFYAGYGEAPDQDAITKQGNAYLSGRFPKLDYIQSAKTL